MWQWLMMGVAVLAGLLVLLVWCLLVVADRADETMERILAELVKPAAADVSIEISVATDDLLKGLESAKSAIDYWIYAEVVRRGIARLLEGEEIVNW